MATLNRLALSTTATAATVTGAGAAGNDQQIKTLLSSVHNRHKRNPWANQMLVTKVYHIDRSPTTQFPRVISGLAEKGMWFKNVFLHTHKVGSTSEAADNVLTVRMYKSTTSLHAAGATDRNSEVAITTNTDNNIIPEVTVRIISGLDDDKHVALPIEMDYVAEGEYWNLVLDPPTGGTKGVHDLDVLIQFATLHR